MFHLYLITFADKCTIGVQNITLNNVALCLKTLLTVFVNINKKVGYPFSWFGTFSRNRPKMMIQLCFVLSFSN